jgi:hypothetical protein
MVLQGLDLQLQFMHLLVVINLLCFDLDLFLLRFFLYAKCVVVSQCSTSSSHTIIVYNFMLFPLVPLVVV